MKSRSAGILAREHLTFETLLLAGFSWLCIAPLISVIVLPWMGAATAIILAAGALLVAYAAAVALMAPAPQPTPVRVTERPQSSRARLSHADPAGRERHSPRPTEAAFVLAAARGVTAHEHDCT